MTLINKTPAVDGSVPQWAVELPANMPLAVYGTVTEGGWKVPGLYDLMLAHPDKMGEISDRLLKGKTGHAEAEAMKAYEEAERDAHRAMQIDALRAEVYEAIHTIRHAALKAAANIARLEAPDVYDVDVTENPDMEYVKSFIEDIRKAGIAAYAILPFDENGDAK